MRMRRRRPSCRTDADHDDCAAATFASALGGFRAFDGGRIGLTLSLAATNAAAAAGVAAAAAAQTLLSHTDADEQHTPTPTLPPLLGDRIYGKNVSLFHAHPFLTTTTNRPTNIAAPRGQQTNL